MELPRVLERAYITGGSGGIGLAIARELVSRGSNVLLIARDPSRLHLAVESLIPFKIFPRQRIETMVLDVSRPGDVSRELAEALSGFGDPDILVNCAGDAYPDYFERIPGDIFEKTLDVHVKGTWYVTRALVEGLKRRRGVVVNVSSVAGLVGVFGYTAYSAAKFGIVGFSEALRSELAPHGVRVSVLCPPDTDTPQLHRENLTKPAETKAVSGKVKALKPEYVARRLFSGLEKKSFLIIPGPSARFTAFMVRHFPGVVRFFMDLTVKRVCRGGNP